MKMADLIIIVYIIIFISIICSSYVAIKLFKNKINYLIGILSVATALIELVVLSSVIWINDFEKLVPRKFCIFQGIALQYCAYLQIISALCFSIHLYQLLVRQKEGNSQTLHKAYIFAIVIIPIIMTIIVSIESIQHDAIQPFKIACDIKNPQWVKLIGYPGFNLIGTIIGAYFSIRAVFKVFRHLDQFKSQMTDTSKIAANKSKPTGDVNEGGVTNEIAEETGVKKDFIRKIRKSYNMTKAAAIRMVLFSFGLTLINTLASVHTVLLFIKGGEDKTTGLRTADFAVAFTGIIIYVIFGLPSLFRKGS
ncbi:unnamed protein product [Rhizophagus irregularis]|nr:unnamed protein product [Rhizophagus irregularis]CAB5365084.1 unnamed protein product [Rhizophagus irregularis]